MAYFRITPGTVITVTLSKSPYEIGEDIYVNAAFSVDAKEIAVGSFWTIYCEVYIFGKKYVSGGDQKFNEWGTTDSATTNLRVHLGKAASVGTFQGYSVAKAKAGI